MALTSNIDLPMVARTMLARPNEPVRVPCLKREQDEIGMELTTLTGRPVVCIGLGHLVALFGFGQLYMLPAAAQIDPRVETILAARGAGASIVSVPGKLHEVSCLGKALTGAGLKDQYVIVSDHIVSDVLHFDFDNAAEMLRK